MSSREAFRLAGLALMVGAVLAFVGSLLNTFLFTGNDPTPYAGNPLFVPVNILSALGSALLLLGLPVLYLSRPEGWGVLGLIGFVLVFATGLMFGIFFSLMSALLLPYLVQHAPDTVKGNGPPAFFPFFIAGTGSGLARIPALDGARPAAGPAHPNLARLRGRRHRRLQLGHLQRQVESESQVTRVSKRRLGSLPATRKAPYDLRDAEPHEPVAVALRQFRRRVSGPLAKQGLRHRPRPQVHEHLRSAPVPAGLFGPRRGLIPTSRGGMVGADLLGDGLQGERVQVLRPLPRLAMDLERGLEVFQVAPAAAPKRRVQHLQGQEAGLSSGLLPVVRQPPGLIQSAAIV